MEVVNSRKKHLEYMAICHLFYNGKYKQVIKRATRYLELYKDNQRIIYFRAYSYKILKKYPSAIEDLNHNIILSEISQDIYELYKIYLELYFIYYNLNMYEQAYNLINKVKKFKSNFNDIELKNFEMSEIILKYKLNIEQSVGKKYLYMKEQLYYYDEDKILNHIKQHSELGKKIDGKTYFYKKIDIDYLYHFIKKNLNKYKKINSKTALDTYFFCIANIGYDIMINSNCNILKVLVIPETNKIINMYPIFDTLGYANELDIDYDKLFSREKEKIKTLSQIDKFNSRYKR